MLRCGGRCRLRVDIGGGRGLGGRGLASRQRGPCAAISFTSKSLYQFLARSIPEGQRSIYAANNDGRRKWEDSRIDIIAPEALIISRPTSGTAQIPKTLIAGLRNLICPSLIRGPPNYANDGITDWRTPFRNNSNSNVHRLGSSHKRYSAAACDKYEEE